MFRKKSTWQRLTEPVTGAVGQPPVKSGLAAVGTALAMTVASAALSAVRRRTEAR